MLTRDRARTWIDRWDRQQEGFLPDREDRFTALIDAVAVGTGRPDPLILDLGCGPGSLAVRIHDRLPAATVVAIDADPLLLALGQAAYGDVPGLRFVSADLRRPGWAAALGLDRPADAAVSSTALHWVAREKLPAVYAEVASALRPGGLVLNADGMEDGDETLRGLERALDQRLRDSVPADGRDGWQGWWDAVREDPDLGGLWRAPAKDHNGEESGTLAAHVEGLRAAGYREVGTLWQRANNRILCGVRG